MILFHAKKRMNGITYYTKKWRVLKQGRMFRIELNLAVDGYVVVKKD